MLRPYLVTLIALVGLAPAAQAQIKLEWKFKETFYVQNVTKTKQTLGDIRGKETTTTALTRYRVLKKTGDGMLLEIQPMGIASTNPLGQPASDLAKDLILRASLNANGKLIKLEGFDEWVKSIAGDNEMVANSIRSMGAEKNARQGLSQTFGFLPDKPVAPGDQWSRPVELSLALFGSLKGDRRYTYDGPGKGTEQLFSFTDDLAYEQPQQIPGLPRKITGDLKVESSKGNLIFDEHAGRLIRLVHRFRVKGTVTLGKSKAFDQESTVTSRVLDEDPIATVRLRDEGTALLRKGEYQAAIETLTRAIKQNPEDPLAYNERGAAYTFLDKDTEAVEDFTRSIKLDDQFAKSFRSRGAAYFRQKKYQEALADFNRAIELDTSYVLAYRGRAALYRKLGKKAEADQDEQTAARLQRAREK